MKLYLIRHGESETNHKKMWTGWMDVNLTENGINQAKNVSKYIKDIISRLTNVAIEGVFSHLSDSFGDEKNSQKQFELFKSAIKNYKKNYLGYMGMCDVLAKSNKKHLKKFKYYKKKCIKYAPSELKENIVRRYE